MEQNKCEDCIVSIEGDIEITKDGWTRFGCFFLNTEKNKYEGTYEIEVRGEEGLTYKKFKYCPECGHEIKKEN